ncbi:ribonuclease R [Solemya pervernicosa gill symbiont]|uniref:Ribonuclease R n=2 Tax=Gammaproteobacteria incertae sedis TaxID=118884 RepID=A0A1T2L7L1_9GAMM|nr:ribonuclease R [Candidatus Reidiella endopervernicosa]OOZ41097.1 ribonuclease R [Solemya pervernicosa gill symbiont]QKQ26259.1 ribonuclease R [Candidatus Reidiella endopervernicosa]
MAKRRPKKDPNLSREAEKYDNPIPSREFIMDLLEERDKLLSRDQIADALGIDDEDREEALRRRLRAMERDGQLIFNRRGGYGLASKMDLVRGRVIGHPDGFGFLVPDEGGDDLFLSPRQMRQLMHGDRAMAHITGVDRRGRPEGAIVEILERSTQQVVGRFYDETGVGVVTPDNKRLTLDILIPPESQGGAEHGQFVLVDIVQQPSKRSQPIGRVLEVMGDHMAPGMEIDVAIRSHDLPLEWPDEVLLEINELSEEVPESAKEGREDLRDIPLVTIDGADSRDFDDAVFCERKPKGWRLLVAIADVSHYVKPGSALDREAYARGNSVYFPERVIPMLPEILSNGLCSINPKVDRLCMVCEMYITDEGKLLRSRFIEGVMRSHARLTYSEMAAMVVDKDSKTRDQHRDLLPHLDELYKLYKVMAKQRKRRGAIDFETTETRITFREDRKIDRIVPVIRNDAHKIIEECMIAANVATAKFLARHKMPTLYRIHDTPKEAKLNDLHEFLGELGLSFKGKKKPEAKAYAKLLKQVQDRPDAHLIQAVMLRSLSQAKYNPTNIGHFGLAHEYYLHFTSPIRRYPDLLVHRAISHVIHKEKTTGVVKRTLKRLVKAGSGREFIYSTPDMESFGEHCSQTERRADEATRDAVDWLKCEYMLDKVGEAYEGIITSVTSFGIFVELNDIYVEGLVHVTSLKNDYYHFDASGHRLRGERTGQDYRLGDSVRVKIVRVDLDERKIDFELDGETVEREAPKKKRRRKRRSGGKGRSEGEKKQGGEKPAAKDDSEKPAPKKKRSRRRRSNRKKRSDS